MFHLPPRLFLFLVLTIPVHVMGQVRSQSGQPFAAADSGRATGIRVAAPDGYPEGSCPGSGDCCISNGSPGCENLVCCDCVCALDPFCCDEVWDGICAGEAAGECLASCPTCALECGDGTCQGALGESCVNCPEDCGECPPTPCDAECACLGDLDLDEATTFQDLVLFLGCLESGSGDGECACADVDGDSSTTFQDLVLFLDLLAGGECIPVSGGDIDEAALEPDCGMPVDTVDGGCGSIPPVFMNIQCGDLICGSSAFDGFQRDTDWFAVAVDEPMVLSWEVTAYFPAVIGFVETDPPGTGDCSDMTGILNPFALTDAGETATLAFEAPTAGIYWAFVSPQFVGVIPCPTPYVAELSCGLGGMTAHRPQHGSGYAPFARTAVAEGDEESAALGPGIRINNLGDSDPAGEDDLIEVELDTNPAADPYALRRSSGDLEVWTTRDKQPGSAIPFTNDKTGALPIGGDGHLTVWVEWTGSQQGTADLYLEPLDRQSPEDTLTFHTFKSIVLALGGENQVPSNPVDPNHGTFVVAVSLYGQGYDVHMYDEDQVASDGSGAVYNEAVTAVQKRAVDELAIFGYSHGGGSTHSLSTRLDNNRATIGDFAIVFTSYVDGIENDSDIDIDKESRRPPSTLFHLNQYQEGDIFDLGLDGGPVSDSNPPPTGLNVETTPWGSGATHFTVDDFQQVRSLIEDSLNQNVSR